MPGGPPAQIVCIPVEHLTETGVGKEPEVVYRSQTLEGFVTVPAHASDLQTGLRGSLSLTRLSHSPANVCFKFHMNGFRRMLVSGPYLPLLNTSAHTCTVNAASPGISLSSFSEGLIPLRLAMQRVPHTPQPSNNAVGYKTPASFPLGRNNTAPCVLCRLPRVPQGN